MTPWLFIVIFGVSSGEDGLSEEIRTSVPSGAGTEECILWIADAVIEQAFELYIFGSSVLVTTADVGKVNANATAITMAAFNRLLCLFRFFITLSPSI
jgi:hypothetical protein